MKKILIATMVISLFSGCGRRGESRLEGTFVSDKAATMEYLESIDYFSGASKMEVSKEGEARSRVYLSSRLGIGRVTWRDGETVSVFPKSSADQIIVPYKESDALETNVYTPRIVDSGSDYIILAYELTAGFVHTSRIDFVANGYWATTVLKEPPYYKEKFTRIAPTSEP